MKKTLLLPLMFLTILGLPTRAFAHAIETNFAMSSDFARKLEMKTTYSTGEPLQQAKVIVYAPDNHSKPWLETTTDDKGRFVFVPDTSIPGEWEIQIIKEEGHEDYLSIPVDSKGIEVNHISQGLKRDIHYAFIPFNPLQTALVAGGMGLTVFLFRRRLK
ncbi:carboxypeptidase-like regulatory domain-containing protein [Gloeothece verrucosa]|uniref:Carboxypeptidase regulatory-like domain-containing protein n=1 Tax=Gloeothece verrucosa (strain PCC 7822) TaxID=497965 RepID=E0UDT7_GLOV7|nr:carboxypeptidase-like regulatory domain-containing protein [Gloeothece verrucosa]ADN16522.1 conserved hypothetical protein [Gloeothece verrucosa PCC 7822]